MKGVNVSEPTNEIHGVDHDTEAAGVPDWFGEALRARPEEGSIDVDGCPIVFRWWGDRSNPVVLLVHGDGAHSRWWDHVAPHLIASSCVVALDLSGHGDSGRRSEYSLQGWAREITGVLEGFGGPDLPVVVGHSAGGHAAIRAATSIGDRLGGLVVVEAAVRESPPMANATRSQVFGRLKVYPTEAAALERFRLWPDSPEALPYILNHVARSSLRRVPGGWSWKFDPPIAIRPDDVSLADLARVTCQVAIIGGERGLLTADAARQMQDRLNRSVPFVEIAGGHHHIMLDQPLQLIAALRTILAEWQNSPIPHRP